MTRHTARFIVLIQGTESTNGKCPPESTPHYHLPPAGRWRTIPNVKPSVSRPGLLPFT